MNSIEISNVTKRFADFTAVDSISFSIAEGELFGLPGRPMNKRKKYRR